MELSKCKQCNKEFDSPAKFYGHNARVHSDRKDQVLIEIKHGTPSGYRSHKRRKEAACSLCQMAWRLYLREYSARRYKSA